MTELFPKIRITTWFSLRHTVCILPLSSLKEPPSLVVLKFLAIISHLNYNQNEDKNEFIHFTKDSQSYLVIFYSPKIASFVISS